MRQSAPGLLLAGPPGSGKPTLVREVVLRLEGPAAGFTTEEVRGGDGRRDGFVVMTLDK